MNRRHLVQVGAALSTGWIAPLASAQVAAGRPVTIVVPYPAGGTADAFARVVARPLSMALGLPVIVDNVSGVGGTLGAQKMLFAPADGMTWMVASPSETILVPLTLASVRYKAEDFRLLAMGPSVPTILMARAGLPFNTLEELLAYSTNPANKSLSFGSVGIGSMPHLVGAHFQQLTGARLLHVPYRGGAPLFQDILAGELDLSFFPLVGPVLGMVSTGKAKVLGLAGNDRPAAAESFASMATHPKLKDFAYPTWSTFAVSASVPEETVVRLNRILNEVLQLPELKTWARETGSVMPAPAALPEIAAFYQGETRKFRDLGKSLQLQPNS